MSENTEEFNKIIEKISPKTLPFARWKREKEIEWYEKTDFSDQAFSPQINGEFPKDVIKFEDLEQIDVKSSHGKYLWVINKNAKLLVLLEETENKANEAREGKIVHSNLTEGEEAYQAGELWFLETDEVYINFESGRYGVNNSRQEEGVLEYFKYKGYDVSCHPKAKRRKR